MILVTGASGYLAQDLLKYLPKNNVRCWYKTLPKDPVADYVIGDICDPKIVAKAVEGIDVVIHAAAVIYSNAEQYQRVNVEGTRNLIQASTKVKHFILISSILAAYEKTTAYGISKRDSEKIVSSSHIPYTIIRLSLLYKKGDTKSIGKLINTIKKIPVFPMIGFGNYPMQPLYTIDAVKAIAKVSESNPRNRTYTLAGPVIKYKSLVKTISSHYGLHRITFPVPPFIILLLLAVAYRIIPNFSFKPSQIVYLTSRKVFDINEAKDLDFNPIDFSEGIKLIG